MSKVDGLCGTLWMGMEISLLNFNGVIRILPQKNWVRVPGVDPNPNPKSIQNLIIFFYNYQTSSD
jgi:hypothetical protein